MAADPIWKRRVLEAPRVERVEALAEYGITLKILGTVRAADQWAAAGDLRKRLLAAFREQRHRDPAAAAGRPRPATPTRDLRADLGPDDDRPRPPTPD